MDALGTMLSLSLGTSKWGGANGGYVFSPVISKMTRRWRMSHDFDTAKTVV